MNYVLLPLLAVFLGVSACTAQHSPVDVPVKTGAELLIRDHLPALEGKRIGLVMNPTARIHDVHVLDTLLALDIDIRALFAPEHGFRGSFSDGEIIEDGIDQQSGLPVYSLYGTSKRPTPEMLAEIDLLLFDMQDVGARFYTFNTTMKYVIEEATKAGKEVWILDRPNPAGGEYVAGWILEEEFESMVGAYPIPVAHGLTLGELALMAAGENWLDVATEPQLKVIRMEGWKRSMKWPDTGLTWIPPSPNLPTFEHAFVYLGTCFIEGTSLSEGRGTSNPFLILGAPQMRHVSNRYAKFENTYHINIDTTHFTPVSIPGKSTYPKFENVRLEGITLSPKEAFEDPVRFGVELTRYLLEQTPEATHREYLYLLSGTKEIISSKPDLNWGAPFAEYLQKRKKYLLY